jgi:hypothetical protein
VNNRELRHIKRLYAVIDRSVFLTTGTLGYTRLTDALIVLADAISTYDGETEDWVYIGEFNTCDLPELIVGAFWHCTEWHGGQWSETYRAYCALSQVFSPGMTSAETDNEAYIALNHMAADDLRERNLISKNSPWETIV